MHRPIVFIFSIIVLFFISCDRCKYLDCVSDNYGGQFRVIDSSSGEDLLFGPQPIYDTSQIAFYTLDGADTVSFDHQVIFFNGDSILSVSFFPPPDTAFLRLSPTDTDTLAMSYSEYDTKCCGNITEIINFRLNNRVNLINEGNVSLPK